MTQEEAGVLKSGPSFVPYSHDLAKTQLFVGLTSRVYQIGIIISLTLQLVCEGLVYESALERVKRG